MHFALMVVLTDEEFKMLEDEINFLDRKIFAYPMLVKLYQAIIASESINEKGLISWNMPKEK